LFGKLAGRSNEVNVISILNRDIDALKIQFVINTAPGNEAQLFALNIIDSFFIKAIETHELLLSDLSTDGKLG